MAEARIILVGHCGADSYALKSAVRRAAPDIEVVSADDDASLAKVAGGKGVFLVNRVLMGDFADTDGLGHLRALAATVARVMLVSNLPHAQAEAARIGALPGFGKAAMNSPEAYERIRQAIASVPASRPTQK